LPRPSRILRCSNKPLPRERLARHHNTRTVHLGASMTCQKSPCTRWWSHAITSKSSCINIIKAAQGQGIGPTCGFVASPEVGLGGTVCTLQTGYPREQDLKDQPHGSRSAPGARELWLHHVPRGTEHATCQKRALMSPHSPWHRACTCQERAPMSPRAPRHRACHPSGKGSSAATCPEAPSPSPSRRWL
jgi:hypothetical protein